MKSAESGVIFFIADLLLTLIAARIVTWRERRIWLPAVAVIIVLYVAANLVAYFIGVFIGYLISGWIITAFITLVAVRIIPQFKEKMANGPAKRDPTD